MTRKTSTSKSPKKSLKPLTGKTETNLTGKLDTKKSSSLKSKTQQQLKNNTAKLTTTGTKSRKKQSKNTLKVMNSRKKDLFPHHPTFPIFLDDLTESKRCWFTCTDHAQKYIDRYKPKYKCYQYTGK